MIVSRPLTQTGFPDVVNEEFGSAVTVDRVHAIDGEGNDRIWRAEPTTTSLARMAATRAGSGHSAAG
jgi:hypothetical protein